MGTLLPSVQLIKTPETKCIKAHLGVIPTCVQDTVESGVSVQHKQTAQQQKGSTCSQNAS
jgi:hypothetical protein